MAGHRNLDDRVPPHDIEAEQSLLGACLLQRRPFEIAVELGMEAGHFYKPAHQYIFQAMTVVSLSGLQIDVVTLSAQLREVQMLDDVGGSSYLLSIQNATPSTSTAKRYAAIILETAQLRNLIDAAARATDLAYSGSDPLAAATTAQEMFAGIVEDTMGFTESRWPLYLTASDIVGQQRTDWVLDRFLLPQEVAILTAGGGAGKALDVDEMIPTPSGMRRMGDLSEGDVVFGADGSQVSVVATSPVWRDREVFRVTTSNGASIVADAGHRWWANSARMDRRKGWREVSTAELARVEANWQIPVAKPTQTPDVPLPVDPYVLGAWLGDGTSASPRITLFDDDFDDIAEELRVRGVPLKVEGRKGRSNSCVMRFRPNYIDGGNRRPLADLGVLDNKHIPTGYLAAGTRQRMDLLGGLLDADGYVSPEGRIEFCTTTQALADGFGRLVAGLGIKATKIESDATIYGRVVGRRWRFHLSFPSWIAPPLKTKRRLARLANRTPDDRQLGVVRIASVTPLGRRDTVCIQVSAADGLFQAGPGHVVTHNSETLRGFAYAAENSLNPWTTESLPGVGRQRALVMDFETQAWNVKGSSMRIRRDVAFWHGLDQSEVFEPAIVQHRGRIDVRNPRDMSEIRRHMRAVRPKLLCIGPLKNIHSQKGSESYETTCLEVTDALMGLMAEFDCALAIESHGTHSDRGQTAGSARWLDWPDISIGMEVISRDDCMDASSSRYIWWFDQPERHESDRLVRLSQRRYARNEDTRIPQVVARQIGNGLPWRAVPARD